MAGRDVTLKIKVDDSDVPRAEASLKRLKNVANGTNTNGSSPALTQQEKLARFMASDLPNASKTTSNALTQVESGMAAVEAASAGAATGMSALTLAAGAVVIAVVAVTVAVVATIAVMISLAQKIYEVSKAYAEHAINAANTAEQQGLQLETSIALTHELEAQGRTYLNLNGAIDSFRKTIGEAAAGSVKARADLKLLGIDGSKAIYDIDGAFKQAAQSIANAPDQFEAVRRAVAAFGDDGYKLLPFFNEFKGDVDAVIKKAEELGIQMSGKNVADAREFTRALADVQAQVDSVTQKFGREFLPIVSDALSRVSGWFDRNEEGITRVSKAARLMVEDVVEQFGKLLKFLDDHPVLVSIVAPSYVVGQRIGQYYRDRVAQDGSQGGVVYSQGEPGTYMNAPTPDVGAIAAQFAYKAKKEKAPEKSEAEKQAEELQKKLQSLKAELQFFGQETQVAAVKQQYFGQTMLGTNQAIYDQIIATAGLIDQKKKDKEWSEKQAKALEDYKKILADIENAGFMKRTDLRAQINAVQEQIDKGRELTLVEQQQIDDATELIKKRRELNNQKGITTERINEAINKLLQEQAETMKVIVDLQAKRNELTQQQKDTLRDAAAKDYQQSLEDELASVMRLERPLTVYEQTLREITSGQHDYTEAQKAGMLVTAEQIDAVRELNRQHAELKDFFKTSLRYIFEGNFKGLLENFKDRFKDMFADKLADVFATSVLGFNPNQTNNPVAKPIVKSIDKTNEILNQMLVKMGGSPVAGAGGASGIGGIFSNIFGGGGNGPGGTPNWNPDRNAGSGGEPLGGGWDDSYLKLWGDGGNTGTSRGPGNIFDNLKKLFSTGPGGLFAPQRNLLTGKDSKLGGILGGAGGLVGLLGGIIGGRAGSVLSGIGTGLQIGAMFGPIGAGIGALIGGIVGIFGIGKKRRREEGIRNQGMLDAQEAIRRQFDALKEDVRFGRIDSASAISQGTSIGETVRSQYLQMANSLTDKKTRNHALADVSRVDSLIAQKMAELRGLSDIANASVERSKRILPEFAGGTYFADFFRPNGLIPGVFDSRDDMMAMLSRGEMVLNPNQQNNVRNLAGFDVFAGAGIPNYPRANPTANLAVGGIASGGLALSASAPTVVVNPTIVIEGVAMDDRIEAYMISDKGTRTQINLQKKLKKSLDI